jgi:hypothetical protein
MRFDTKNPKFMIDLITLIFATTVIVLAIIVMLSGMEALIPFVFFAGAAMFAANVIRGLISSKYLAMTLIIPSAACLTGGLISQGVIRPWTF